ncbi:MAG: OadG family protein [Muribaculaceae bacterium]|nr:OadG family protein [Muribaculaceae bacterium]
MLISANWGQAWTVTGMGIGVVFVILILLVIVLYIFESIVKKQNDDSAVKVGIAQNGPVKPLAQASELDKAAVATALYLYEKSKGDQESGVLTIKHTQSGWHAVLNERL